MKKITLIIAMTILSFLVFSASPPGTNVGGIIAPTDSADIFATHNALWGKGGWREVADTVARNAIPVLRRDTGMVVFTYKDSTTWQLRGGVANSNWIKLLSDTALVARGYLHGIPEYYVPAGNTPTTFTATNLSVVSGYGAILEEPLFSVYNNLPFIETFCTTKTVGAESGFRWGSTSGKYPTPFKMVVKNRSTGNRSLDITVHDTAINSKTLSVLSINDKTGKVSFNASRNNGDTRPWNSIQIAAGGLDVNGKIKVDTLPIITTATEVLVPKGDTLAKMAINKFPKLNAVTAYSDGIFHCSTVNGYRVLTNIPHARNMPFTMKITGKNESCPVEITFSGYFQANSSSTSQIAIGTGACFNHIVDTLYITQYDTFQVFWLRPNSETNYSSTCLQFTLYTDSVYMYTFKDTLKPAMSQETRETQTLLNDLSVSKLDTSFRSVVDDSLKRKIDTSYIPIINGKQDTSYRTDPGYLAWIGEGYPGAGVNINPAWHLKYDIFPSGSLTYTGHTFSIKPPIKGGWPGRIAFWSEAPGSSTLYTLRNAVGSFSISRSDTSGGAEIVDASITSAGITVGDSSVNAVKQISHAGTGVDQDKDSSALEITPYPGSRDDARGGGLYISGNEHSYRGTILSSGDSGEAIIYAKNKRAVIAGSGVELGVQAGPSIYRRIGINISETHGSILDLYVIDSATHALNIGLGGWGRQGGGGSYIQFCEDYVNHPYMGYYISPQISRSRWQAGTSPGDSTWMDSTSVHTKVAVVDTVITNYLKVAGDADTTFYDSIFVGATYSGRTTARIIKDGQKITLFQPGLAPVMAIPGTLTIRGIPSAFRPQYPQYFIVPMIDDGVPIAGKIMMHPTTQLTLTHVDGTGFTGTSGNTGSDVTTFTWVK